MMDSTDHNPTPLTNGNLADLLDSGTGSERPVLTQVCHNMGNRTFLFQLPMKVFYDQSMVANDRGTGSEPIAQRPLNLPHATKLAKYMLKGLVTAAQFRRTLAPNPKPESPALAQLEKTLGKQPYVSMQPMVCNLRNVDPTLRGLRADRVLSKETNETVGFKVWLSQSNILHVVDGQHRRMAMHILFDFLNKTISKPELTSKGNLLMPLKGPLSNDLVSALQEVLETGSAFASVQVECHIGLDIDQERQLFHDLNNLGKKVEASLALQFDNSNPVNVFIKDVLIDDDTVLSWEVIEKDVADWNNDLGAITRKDLVSINARLFLNKTNISGASPGQVEPNKELVTNFWLQVAQIPGLGLPGAKLASVAAQPVVLKALAKLTYDYGVGKKANSSHLQALMETLVTVDFTHVNPMWRYYQLDTDQRKLAGLESLKEYLPSDDEGYNRDIGNFDEKVQTMRFGAKHNDIFPIIGDMIRWKLSLPSRHSK